MTICTENDAVVFDEEHFDQFCEKIGVVPMSVIDNIRTEIGEEFSKTASCNREYRKGLNKAFCIIDKYRAEREA